MDAAIQRRAGIYARYSSDEQRSESIDAQVRACKEYAENHGYAIVKIYADEAISGKGSSTKKRVSYQKMLRDIEAGKLDAVLIHKYDRVARNVMEHVTLASRLSNAGVELIATAQDYGNSKEAKVMKVLTWAMSELYVDNLAEETRKGHKENALKALHNGGVSLFGYDVVDKHYIVNELEAAYVKRLFDATLRGEKVRPILDEMKAAGIKGRRGRTITYPSVYEMLKNERYTGTYVYCEVRKKDHRDKSEAIKVDNAFPAIVSREVWEGVQKVMETRKNAGRNPKTPYLLSGKIVCGECGSPMHGLCTNRTKKGVTYEYRYYACSKKCGNRNVRAEEAEKIVYEYLRMILDVNAQKALKAALKAYSEEIEADAESEKAKVKKAIANKEQQIEAAVKNLTSTQLPPSVVERMGNTITELQNQIAVLQRELLRPSKFSDEEIDDYFSRIGNLEEASDKLRRDTVKAIIDKVEISKNSASVKSTLAEFLRNVGLGDAIPIIPKIFIMMSFARHD